MDSIDSISQTRSLKQSNVAITLNQAGEPIGDHLPEHLSFDVGLGNPLESHTREELHQMAVQWGEEAQRSFDASIAKLSAVTRACEPVTLLSHFAYYDTVFHESYKTSSGYSPAEQHHVEFLQSLILTIPEDQLQNDYPTPEQRMEVNALLKAAGSGFALKRLATESGLATIIREQARAGTQFVRNPGSQGQILRNLKELFSPLDPLLSQCKGVTFSGLIAMCEGFMEQIVSRINSHREILQRCYQQPTREAMIENFCSEFSLPASEIAYLKGQDALQSSSVENTKAALFNYSERVFPEIFLADLNELSNMYSGAVNQADLVRALSVWSLKFGTLQSVEIEHLFLNNPIWPKPFIELSDGLYFWPIFPSFVSFGMEMLEAQFEGNQSLKYAYHERRAQFTEDKAAELMIRFGPGARLFRNLKWRDSQSNRELENDILVLIDTHAIILECKSGRIKEAARRGGRSLEESLKKLIQEPTEQGYRFEQFLRTQQGVVHLQDNKGKTEEIDGSAILSFTRINILLDFWGPLACQDKLLRKIGMISCSAPAAVSMALVDLENLLYLIESPGQRLHYLHRRADLERSFEIIGDELDLIAYYLGGGLWPSDQQTNVHLLSASYQLDPFLRRRDLGLSKKIPALKLNKWWKDLLEQIETKAFHGWTEAAIILLSFPFENQEQYSSQVQATLVETSISPQQTQGREIICATYPTPTELVGLATHVTTRATRDQSRAKTSQALNALASITPRPKRMLAMTIFPDSYPYNNLALGAE
jgi:hypothetical protein